MEKNFQKGASDNLPKVTASMMAMYFKDNLDFTSAEIRGVKADRSARESYGDNAIGSKSKELNPVDKSYLAEFLVICQEKEVGNIQLTNMFLPAQPEKALSVHSLHVEYLSMT
ncbi:hypothetical protein JTE90_012124, partial [Oedothorax gibbosus]